MKNFSRLGKKQYFFAFSADFLGPGGEIGNSEKPASKFRWKWSHSQNFNPLGQILMLLILGPTSPSICSTYIWIRNALRQLRDWCWWCFRVVYAGLSWILSSVVLFSSFHGRAHSSPDFGPIWPFFPPTNKRKKCPKFRKTTPRPDNVFHMDWGLWWKSERLTLRFSCVFLQQHLQLQFWCSCSCCSSCNS